MQDLEVRKKLKRIRLDMDKWFKKESDREKRIKDKIKGWNFR